MNKSIFPLICLILFACSNKEENQTQNTDTAQMQAHHSGLVWKTPAGWQEEPPANAMRKAQWNVPKAEGDPEDGSVVITHFPGQGAVGGEEANLRRWYGQFSQPDGSSSAEKATVEDKQINNLDVTTVELTGTYLHKPNMMAPDVVEKPDFKMLAAIVKTPKGPYFIKFIGPEDTVNKWEDSFDEFLQTLTI